MQRRKRKPVGSEWRILAYGGGKSVALYSKDYAPDGTKAPRVPFPSVFDELVISGVIHVEQMNDREWWVGLGNGEMFMISVGRDGTVERGEIYR